MNRHNVVNRVSSAALRVPRVDSISVRARAVPAGGIVPPGGRTAEGPRPWIVVLQAVSPSARLLAAPASPDGTMVAGLHVGAVVVPGPLAPPGPANVATSLITTDVGTPGVRVLLTKSLRADSDQSAFGVT